MTDTETRPLARTNGDSSANRQAFADQLRTIEEMIERQQASEQPGFESERLARMSPGGGSFKKYEPTVEEHNSMRRRLGPEFADYTYFAFDRINKGIKIGRAQWPSERLARFNSTGAYKMVLLAVVRDGDLELPYHRKFQAHRIVGEWFAPHPDILAEIERLNAPHPEAAA